MWLTRGIPVCVRGSTYWSHIYHLRYSFRNCSTTLTRGGISVRLVLRCR